MTYFDKLKDPRWQKRRLEILNRDDFTCVLCGSKDEELQIHHTNYKRGVEPWEASDGDLATLCKICHKQAEELVKTIRRNSACPVTFHAYVAFHRLLSEPECFQNTVNIVNMLSRMKDLVEPIHDTLICCVSRENQLRWRLKATEENNAPENVVKV